MNTKLAVVCLLVAGLFVAPIISYADEASTSNSSASKESTAQFVDDATITTKVKAEFLKDKDVSALKVKVKTNKGVVWLSGTAKSRDVADKAVSIAQGIDGVKDVKSNIKVKAD